MDFLFEGNILLYIYSAMTQAIGALLALVGVFVVFYLELKRSRIRGARETLRREIKEADTRIDYAGLVKYAHDEYFPRFIGTIIKPLETEIENKKAELKEKARLNKENMTKAVLNNLAVMQANINKLKKKQMNKIDNYNEKHTFYLTLQRHHKDYHSVIRQAKGCFMSLSLLFCYFVILLYSNKFCPDFFDTNWGLVGFSTSFIFTFLVIGVLVEFVYSILSKEKAEYTISFEKIPRQQYSDYECGKR